LERHSHCSNIFQFNPGFLWISLSFFAAEEAGHLQPLEMQAAQQTCEASGLVELVKDSLHKAIKAQKELIQPATVQP